VAHRVLGLGGHDALEDAVADRPHGGVHAGVGDLRRVTEQVDLVGILQHAEPGEHWCRRHHGRLGKDVRAEHFVERGVEEVLLQPDRRFGQGQLGQDVSEPVEHLLLAAKRPDVVRMRHGSHTRQITIGDRHHKLAARRQKPQCAR
jgi:hypothetical protein